MKTGSLLIVIVFLLLERAAVGTYVSRTKDECVIGKHYIERVYRDLSNMELQQKKAEVQ